MNLTAVKKASQFLSDAKSRSLLKEHVWDCIMSLSNNESWDWRVTQMPIDELRALAMQTLDRLFQTDDEYGEVDVRFLESDPDHCAYMVRRNPSARWTESESSTEFDLMLPHMPVMTHGNHSRS